MSVEITPPQFESTNLKASDAELVKAGIENFDLWNIPHGMALPVDLARALRVIHIRDFTLRALMPDSSYKFNHVEEATHFTTSSKHKREAYVLTAQEQVAKETNLAAFGWFRPLLDPRVQGDYEDYDLVAALIQRSKDPGVYVTAAIEVFAGYRQQLTAASLIEASLRDFSEKHPELQGVCVRVGTPRAINMVEHTDFARLTSEEGGGGIFVRELR